jgi:hypothetical protein
MEMYVSCKLIYPFAHCCEVHTIADNLISQTEEEMIMCKPLPTHTTGEDIFNLMDLYMSEKGLCWKHCVDICTGGAQSVIYCARLH